MTPNLRQERYEIGINFVNVCHSGDYGSALHLLVVRAGRSAMYMPSGGENSHVKSKDDP